MSVLDDTFTFFTKTPPEGWVRQMDATLTGTKLPSLSGFLATASVKPPSLTYVTGVPDTTSTSIGFDANVKCQADPGPKSPPSIQVTLYQNPVTTGGGYSMDIVLPWKTLKNCVANVDATSGVVYGSKGDWFVTLVLKASTVAGPPL